MYREASGAKSKQAQTRAAGAISAPDHGGGKAPTAEAAALPGAPTCLVYKIRLN